MSQLRARDAEELLGFVADAQSVGGPEPFTTELLDRLATVMETEFASYYEFDPVHDVAYEYVVCSNEKRLSPPPGSTPVPHNPERGDFGSWSHISDRPARLRFETTSWARQYHVIDCAWRVFRLSPFDCASLLFHSQDRDFSERDRQKIVALSPHIAALIRNSRARRRLADLKEAMASADESEPQGFVVLGNGVEIEHASPAARRLLGEWFGTNGTRLPPPVVDWLTRTSRAGPLRVEGDGTRLVVEAATKRALVMTEEPATTASLTAREVEVMRLVGAGKSTAEIASELWVTPATVSKHLEHVYRKLGVASRTAALATLVQPHWSRATEPFSQPGSE